MVISARTSRQATLCGLGRVEQTLTEAQIDQALVEEAREGNSRAFEQLLSRYEARVLRILRLSRVPINDREDVGQEVFIRVFKHLGRFRKGNPFAAWVYRITINVAHDYRLKQARIARSEVDYTAGPDDRADEGPGPGAELDRQDGRRRLEQAIEVLSERERAVFILCELEELGTRETAKILGITAITVRRHLGRARERLRRCLSDTFSK